MDDHPTRTETAERFGAKGLSKVGKKSLLPFSLVLLYLFLEYGRPQDLLPFLGIFRLPGITVLILLFYILTSGKIDYKDKQTRLIVLLLGLMVVHGPIAVNNYEALMTFILMSMNFIVFLSMVLYVDDPQKYESLIDRWLKIFLFLAIIGVIKKGRGIGGFMTDENDFCITMNMILPFPFFLAINASAGKKIYYIALTALFLFVIILTNSRGGFVGLIATSIYCWFRTKRKVLTALIMAFLALFAVLIAPPSYRDRVRSITEEGADKGTGAERVFSWKIGWKIFLDHPFIGVGQGNFPYVSGVYEGKEGYYGRSLKGRAAHSVYFTLLPELGLVGTFLFLGVLFHTFKDLNTIRSRLWRKKPAVPDPYSSKYFSLSLALEGSLVSFLVSGAFISVLYYPIYWVLLGFIVSLKKIVVRQVNPIPV